MSSKSSCVRGRPRDHRRCNSDCATYLELEIYNPPPAAAHLSLSLPYTISIAFKTFCACILEYLASGAYIMYACGIPGYV